MVWKVEWFKYEKLETKGCSLKILEVFVRAWGSHMHTRAPLSPSPALSRHRRGCGHGTFWTGPHTIPFGPGRADASARSWTQNWNRVVQMRAWNPILLGAPPLVSRNGRLSTTEITVLTRTVWTVVAVLFIRMVVTVLSELLHPLNADQEAINSAPLTRSNIQHNNTQHSNKDWRKNLNLRVVQTEFLSLLSFLLQWIVLQIQT